MVSYISVLFYEEQQKCAGRYCVFSSLSLVLFLLGIKKRQKFSNTLADLSPRCCHAGGEGGKNDIYIYIYFTALSHECEC